MDRRKKILYSLLGITIVFVLALEVYDHFYSLIIFAEPAFPHAGSFTCKNLVVYKPFWRDEVYALDMTEPGDWLKVYYAGDQEKLKKAVMACKKANNQSRLYY